MNSLVKKLIIGFGMGVVIMASSLWWHKRNEQPEAVLEVEESNYPLSDYLFVPKQQQKEDPKDSEDYKRLEQILQENAKQITALKAQLKQASQKPPPKITPQPTQEPQIDSTQQDILASRIKAFEISQDEPKEQEPISVLDYGVDHFDNLKAKDVATHENRLLRTITADKMIPAFLITPISSQLGGKVIAQVESDVFANMGRAILIPKGSKVIGYYNNNNKIGEYRLDIVWTRILTPQGVNIMLTNAKGADVKGYSGLVGEMITHNFQRYGMPLLVSTISNGLLIALTSAIANKTGKNNFFGDYLLMQMTRQTGMGLNQIVAQILRDKSNLKPIIIIREGSRVFIAPNLDIFFPVPKEGEILAQFFTHSLP
ncbi:DNA type IV secretion system protein ComB10 [Helicobacter suis]|uniref:DNA type IV secretion system protein ComB10 n=1 Tax=Helicobacter suis TaxID=104628 RepID=UPI0018F80693